jgi:hypothetical protein
MEINKAEQRARILCKWFGFSELSEYCSPSRCKSDASHDEWFEAQVQVGIDQIKRGEFIGEEEMDARVERMLLP